MAEIKKKPIKITETILRDAHQSLIATRMTTEQKVKQLSPEEMIELAEVIMPNVKTDVDERDIYSYLLAVVRMGTTKIHQFSLPIEGGYTSQTIRGQSCLVPDLPSNKSALKKFLFKS